MTRSVAGDGRPGRPPLRILTVRQPWAWAIMVGAKRVENRTWSIPVGERIAIHAGLSFDQSAYRSEPLLKAWQALDDRLLTRGGAGPLARHNPLLRGGVILGTVDVVDDHLCDRGFGCYRVADVLGWVPYDGSDPSEPGWEPRFCSTWGHVPETRPRRGQGRQHHLVLDRVTVLQHPIPYTGRLGLRRLDAGTESTVRARIESESPRPGRHGQID